MFESGDAILAHRGIMVQDILANKNVHINAPKMLKGKSRFEPHEIVQDCHIASKRIHIERIITVKNLHNSFNKHIFESRIIYYVHPCPWRKHQRQEGNRMYVTTDKSQLFRIL